MSSSGRPSQPTAPGQGRRLFGTAVASLGLALVVRAASTLPRSAAVSEPQLIAAALYVRLAPAGLPLLAGTALLAWGLTGRRRWWAAAPLALAVVVVLGYGTPWVVALCRRPGGGCG